MSPGEEVSRPRWARSSAASGALTLSLQSASGAEEPGGLENFLLPSPLFNQELVSQAQELLQLVGPFLG